MSKAMGVEVTASGEVRVTKPEDCPKCGGHRSFDGLQINGSNYRVEVVCKQCGQREIEEGFGAENAVTFFDGVSID